jgi:Flp pilus assembly secretin CpaC
MTIITAASAEEDLMHIRLSRRRALELGVAGTVAATSLPALAHHGWNWAEDQQSELKGTVKSVSMAPPHPSLKVTAADGKEWLIDLANPNQTERSGFTAASAKAGDAIVVLGNRSNDKSQLWMKAVRITVAGKTYDLYPERIKTN